jgi:hypothetical protein
MNRSTMIGVGIGATAGGISGFLSPNDTFQERIVSAGVGALLGGFTGGGLVSAVNYPPGTKKTFISKGPRVGKKTNVKFGRVTKGKKAVPAGKIKSVASGVAGSKSSSTSSKKKTKFPKPKKTGEAGSSYYKRIDAFRAAGDQAGMHKAYVDSINHANRVGNTAALKRFKNDPYANSNKILSGKLNGIWS